LGSWPVCSSFLVVHFSARPRRFWWVRIGFHTVHTTDALSSLLLSADREKTLPGICPDRYDSAASVVKNRLLPLKCGSTIFNRQKMAVKKGRATGAAHGKEVFGQAHK